MLVKDEKCNLNNVNEIAEKIINDLFDEIDYKISCMQCDFHDYLYDDYMTDYDKDNFLDYLDENHINIKILTGLVDKINSYLNK